MRESGRKSWDEHERLLGSDSARTVFALLNIPCEIMRSGKCPCIHEQSLANERAREHPRETTQSGNSKAGLSVLLGVICGGICGAVILSFGALIGRSGSTGTEYFGYWDASLIWLGLLYGGASSAFSWHLLLTCFSCANSAYRRPFRPALIGTLTGGLAGAIAGPPLAVVTGILVFPNWNLSG